MARPVNADYVVTRKTSWVLIALCLLGVGLATVGASFPLAPELGRLLAYGASGILLAPHLPIWESTE